MKERYFAQDVKNRIKNRFEMVTVDKNDYYYHPTVYISSISEYIQLIEAISNVGDKSIYYDKIVYRGMPDDRYRIVPGLARLNDLYEETEKELIDNFRSRRPDAFAGLTEFDILAKMQHYGLPTRLLDFTLNPLVALYFACESKPSLDGRVLCHGSYLLNDSSPYIKAISEAAVNKPFDECYTIDDYLCNDTLSARRYMSEVYLHKETKIVRPKYWNHRITNQAGVFMMFSNNLTDRYAYILIHAKQWGLERAIQEYGRGEIAISDIERALKYEPVNLYAKEYKGHVTDKIFRKMYDSYKDTGEESEFWESLGRRFQTECELKALDTDRIMRQFFSIKIRKNDKKRIIQNLSQIGISEDYIYPELEYTAKEVRRRFE